MSQSTALSPEEIRQAQNDHSKLRARDLADKLGLSEAQLLAAQCGLTATRIDAHPDTVMVAAQTFGEVMALTRNDACVHEKVGIYDNYHPGTHAAMVLTEQVDLRIFPSHWCHAFLVETDAETGPRQSVQVFDAAGDAVHKVFLRDGSDRQAWERAKAELAVEDRSQTLAVQPRKPVEAAKSDPAKLDILHKEWRRMTDTHQFLRLVAKLKMNRLGAYRIAGAPFVRALQPIAVDDMLHKLADTGLDVMIFVGNRGCIQIHTGPIHTLRAMGPWQNVMDPGFNLHLRLDKIAEVWAVEKPTQRGPALSVEAFDAEGGLILQAFGISKEERDNRKAWGQLVETLPSLHNEEAVTS